MHISGISNYVVVVVVVVVFVYISMLTFFLGASKDGGDECAGKAWEKCRITLIKQSVLLCLLIWFIHLIYVSFVL